MGETLARFPFRRAPHAAIRSFAAFASVAVIFVCGARAARAATTVTWQGPVGGNWLAGSNWTGGIAPNNGTPAGARYLATVGQSAAQYALTFQSSGRVELDQLTINANANVWTVNPLTTIALRDPAAGTPALTGGGKLLLGGSRLEILGSGGRLTHAAGNRIELSSARILGNGILDNRGTITGSGLIGSSQGTTDASVQILNMGTSGSLAGSPQIIASGEGQTLTLSPKVVDSTVSSFAVNSALGILGATDGATLVLKGPNVTVNNDGGEIRATNNGIVRFEQNVILRRGKLVGSGGGSFVVPSQQQATFQNFFNPSGLLKVDGNLFLDNGVNNGTIELTGNITGVFENNGGTITMKLGSSGFAPSLDYTAGSLITTASSVIQGGGTFNGRSTGASLTQAGLVHANLASTPLEIRSGVNNDGSAATFRASGNATLKLGLLGTTQGMYNDATFISAAGSTIEFNLVSQFSHVNSGVQNAGTFKVGSSFARFGTITGPGNVLVNGLLTSGAVRAGALNVAGTHNLKSGTATASRLGTLSIGASGKLDVQDNALLVDDSASFTPATARTAIAAGRLVAGAGWSVGYARADAIGDPATWRGENLNSATLLILATRAGDADLNRIVNFDDLLRLARKYGTPSNAFWSDGDSNYDGDVDFDDLLALAKNYQGSTGAPASQAAFASDWSLAQSLVPEPTALATVGATTSLLALRRRR